jgi:alanine racemase
MTHLADTDGERTDYTEEQLVRFNRTLKRITARGIRIPLIHATNSGGAVRFPRAQFTMVRPGIMLYGYHTLPPSVPVPDLRPVLSLRTCVAQLRTVVAGGSVGYNRTFVAKQPTRIAVLPVGYADGFSRRLSNRGYVLIQGHRAPVVGTVCMDMVMVDVTAIPGVMVGDDAVVIGRQGQEEVTATDIAAWTDTIPYEVLCSIGPRVPRLYQAS